MFILLFNQFYNGITLPSRVTAFVFRKKSRCSCVSSLPLSSAGLIESFALTPPTSCDTIFVRELCSTAKGLVASSFFAGIPSFGLSNTFAVIFCLLALVPALKYSLRSFSESLLA